MLHFSCVLVVLVLLVPAAGANGPADTDPSGRWVGRCRGAGKDVFLRLQLRAAAGGTTGTAFSRLLDIRNAPVSSTRAGQLNLSFPTPQGAVALSCELREGRLEGTAEHGGATGPCTFVRLQPMDPATF